MRTGNQYAAVTLFGTWAALSSACVGGDPGMEVSGPLVDPSAWEALPSSEDVFDDRPADARCDPNGMNTLELPEEAAEVGGVPGATVFEVHTGDCPYVTAMQPSLGPLLPGQRVDIRLWHFALLSTEAAKAHVAIQIGDSVVWEREVPIPQPAGLLEGSWVADRDVPMGAPVYFHLHNHGTNTWALWEVTASNVE